MALYLYKSISGRTLNVGNYVVTKDGIGFPTRNTDLDPYVGDTINRYIDGVLTNTEPTGGSVTSVAGGTAIDDTDTIDGGSGTGYTVGQIVAILKQRGILPA